MAGALLNIARGAVMGGADVVPGVSGGTMALILGVYERFITALAALPRLARPATRISTPGGRRAFAQAARDADLWFLIHLGLGIVAAVVVGAHLIGWALERYPAATMALFFGLILASARIPWHRIPTRQVRQYTAALIGALVAAATIFLPAADGGPGTGFLVLAGMLAITAMLLPGISGSALLVLLGVYPTLLGAIQALDPVVLGMFGLGAVAGLLLASRGIRWLLEHRHDTTMAALSGLMVGSLVRVWPWRTGAGFAEGLPAAPDTFLPVLWLLAGVALSLGLEAMGGRRGRPAPA